MGFFQEKSNDKPVLQHSVHGHCAVRGAVFQMWSYIGMDSGLTQREEYHPLNHQHSFLQTLRFPGHTSEEVSVPFDIFIYPQ